MPLDATATVRRLGSHASGGKGGGARDAPAAEHPIGLGEDSGPHPVVRAAAGLVVGLAAGALAAALTLRPERARRSPATVGTRDGLAG